MIRTVGLEHQVGENVESPSGEKGRCRDVGCGCRNRVEDRACTHLGNSKETRKFWRAFKINTKGKDITKSMYLQDNFETRMQKMLL